MAATTTAPDALSSAVDLGAVAVVAANIVAAAVSWIVGGPVTPHVMAGVTALACVLLAAVVAARWAITAARSRASVPVDL